MTDKSLKASTKKIFLYNFFLYFILRYAKLIGVTLIIIAMTKLETIVFMNDRRLALPCENWKKYGSIGFIEGVSDEGKEAVYKAIADFFGETVERVSLFRLYFFPNSNRFEYCCIRIKTE